MNQFVVPQFIDVEDKIFGPITTRQFLILLAAGLMCFVAFKLADTALFLFFLFLIGGSALLLAFLKVNGQPFHFFILNVVQIAHRPSLRIWNKIFSNKELNEWRKAPATAVTRGFSEHIRPDRHRLRDLSLIVNTGGYYRPN